LSTSRRSVLAALAALAAAAFAGEAGAATLRVPQDHATIQAAIDAAVPGDTVSVSPGVYHELVNNNWKAVTIESTAGAASTTIDGDGGGPVVRLLASPGETPVLRGFTIRDGTESDVTGGIYTRIGPALIENNRVVDVRSCAGAIYAEFSKATIRNNVVTGTRPSCSPAHPWWGAGIELSGEGTAAVTGNVVDGNAVGIRVIGAGTPTISENTITSNLNFGIHGGYDYDPFVPTLIANNVIAGNLGHGFYWHVAPDTRGPFLVNNTIADNAESAIRLEGDMETTRVANNVVVGSSSSPTFDCPADLSFGTAPIVEFNDVFSRGTGAVYGGVCAGHTGHAGNISADPLFAGETDYRLRPGSPAIDAGTSDGAPAADFGGVARPQDGDGDGTPAVDMGAYEAAAVAAGPRVSGSGAFATDGQGEVTFALSDDAVTLRRARGQSFAFTGDVTSVTGSGNAAVLRGAGSWNGTDGYAFEVSAVDDAEGRRRTDTIEVVIRDPSGDVVFSSGEPRQLKRGNIEVVPAAPSGQN
jgi:parallel beta-helix repeat protein